MMETFKKLSIGFSEQVVFDSKGRSLNSMYIFHIYVSVFSSLREIESLLGELS